MEKPNLDFSILGAGIGGLTLALALKRRGIDVAVYERASSISEIGAGLLLSPNAVSILYAIGLKEELPAISVETPEWRVLDSKGRYSQKSALKWGKFQGSAFAVPISSNFLFTVWSPTAYTSAVLLFKFPKKAVAGL